MKHPVAIDLCCGHGGWTDGLQAAGFRVIGYDIWRSRRYAGSFIKGDVRTLCGREFSDAGLIVASPPCTQFSRLDMPFHRDQRSRWGCPSLDVVDACFRIGRESGVPFILENVRGLQRFIGNAQAHYGPFYLWGDVPALLPPFGERRVFKMVHRSPRLRGMIPFQLAHHIGKCFLPAPSQLDKQHSRTVDLLRQADANCHKPGELGAFMGWADALTELSFLGK